MRYLILTILFILVGCRSTLENSDGDQFDKILAIKKSNDTLVLKRFFGEPKRVDSADPLYDQYFYDKGKNRMPMKIFFNRKTKSIETIALTYWVDFDAYAYLKKRFNQYQWQETPVPSKAVDVVDELYHVEIPSLGMSFQFNNQDPLRRPMWIYFK